MPARAATTDVSLVYGISVGGVRIGEVEVNARFDGNGYAVSLSGATRGVAGRSPMPPATMSARGIIRNGRVFPAEFQLSMTEGVDGADATMTLRDRAVVDLTVIPGLVPWFDLVPLTMEHVRNIVDPMSAMIAPVRRIEGLTASEACNRTIPVFDGWSRYDVTLGGGEVRTVVGAAGGYSGLVYVCGAGYRPIAGHRSSEAPVVYMEGNSRLQATLMPIEGQLVLIPTNSSSAPQMATSSFGSSRSPTHRRSDSPLWAERRRPTTSRTGTKSDWARSRDSDSVCSNSFIH